MPATVTTTLFLARERPQASTAADGTFQLVMLTMEPLGPHIKEPWRLTWAGEDARAWWTAHGASLQPGQPFQVSATRLRAFIQPRGPEIHARVLSLALAPWRHEAAANSAERAAA